jgi:hypothetical protein
MLGGARRPPPPNYLAIACSALREVIRIDKRLLPYMAEQKQMLERWLLDKEIEASLRKVYGPPDPAHVKPSVNMSPAPSAAQFLKEEQALAKTRAVVDLLKGKMR